MTTDTPPCSRRPGGRSARVRAQVFDAARDLLAEGPDKLTISQLAERSGVHHATIYRRWGSVEGVVLALAADTISRESPVPNTGSLRGDLMEYARRAAASIEGPNGLTMIKGLITATDESPDAVMTLVSRATDIEAMLDRATARGEQELHVTRVIDGILAPIYFRRIFGIGGVNEDYLGSLVDTVLARS